MNKKIRILYLMHIHWDWTKQRPQFLAEKLSEKYALLVVYPYSFKRTLLANNPRNKVNAFPFLLLPLTGKLSRFEKTRQVLSHIGFWVLQWLWKPDFVWVTGPQIDLPEFVHKKYRLIYDCMDDMMEMPLPAYLSKYIRISEKRLIEQSSIVFCSSTHLKHVLYQRYSMPVSPIVLHNACEPSELQSNNVLRKNNAVNTIGYIGGVSSWFDKKAIQLLVDNFPLLTITIVGPVDKELVSFFSMLPRVELKGHIPHYQLNDYVKKFDAMIMPFIPNKLIQSVDPVKLYEYIHLKRTIYSVYYPELQKFERFIEFYENHDQLIQLVNRGFKTGFQKKYSDYESDEFISVNTWDYRAKAIQQILDDKSIIKRVS